MRLDSARELKARLLARHVDTLVAMPRRAASLRVAARAVRDLDETPRTMALGIVRTNGDDFHIAVRIQNEALIESEELTRIRTTAKGEVDVRYVGRLVKRAAWYRRRQRPLLIGVSIGHYRITAGTLGCFVRTRVGGHLRVLSNNHVLADENRGKKGDAIIQPGQFDGGKKGQDNIGTLDRFIKLRDTETNYVDAALGTIKNRIPIEFRTLTGFGSLNGMAADPVEAGEEVAKLGRTTGLTRGRVTAFELDHVVVAYDRGNLRFDNQIEIEGAGAGPFSQGGDSGSLIIDRDGLAVALLFAGGDQGGSNGRGLTYGNPIRTVLDALAVDLAS